MDIKRLVKAVGITLLFLGGIALIMYIFTLLPFIVVMVILGIMTTCLAVFGVYIHLEEIE